MRVLLLAPDSKLPNLAIMKLSAYHKARGDEVSMSMSEPDRIYISVVFSWNSHIPKSIKFIHPNAEIVAGGPGYDPQIRLPEDIEATPPDRSIYPPDGYTYGRVTTGCPRKCPFCMVHIQEPNGIRYIQHPRDIWIPGTILRLFDDNILAHTEAWNDLVNWATENDVRLRLEYLDIRLVTPENAAQLHTLKHDNSLIYLAFDTTGIEKAVRRGVGLLVEAGFRPAQLRFLVYCHDEEAVPDAKYRWSVLRELGCEPFLMVNTEARTPALKRLARRCARPAIWRNADIDKLFDLKIRPNMDIRTEAE